MGREDKIIGLENFVKQKFTQKKDTKLTNGKLLWFIKGGFLAGLPLKMTKCQIT